MSTRFVRKREAESKNIGEEEQFTGRVWEGVVERPEA